jgi:hypothetical protein
MLAWGDVEQVHSGDGGQSRIQHDRFFFFFFFLVSHTCNKQHSQLLLIDLYRLGAAATAPTAPYCGLRRFSLLNE